jgi:hypothetical protein
METKLITGLPTDFKNMFNDAIDIITENYPNFEHSTTVKRGVLNISCYTKGCLGRKRFRQGNQLFDVFSKKAADNYSDNGPQLGPS